MQKEEKDFRRNKFINTLFANIFSGKHFQQFSTYKSQTGEKNLNHKEGFWRYGVQKQGCSHDYPIMGANANIIKKEKKDIS